MSALDKENLQCKIPSITLQHITAFCLILYFLCSHLTVPILCLVETVEAELEDTETLKNSCNNTEDLDDSALDLAVNAEPSPKCCRLYSSLVQFFYKPSQSCTGNLT